MEQNFQTSFIPKKPMIQERATAPRPVGVLMIASMLILFTTILSSLGLYFYDRVLKNSIVKMQNDLNLAKNRFEPSKITELQVLDKRLRAGAEILSKHITVYPIFKVLQDITMQTVRYNKFSYELDSSSQNPMVKVSMQGIAVGYRSIALQSDLFSKNKNLTDPVFSNLALNDSGNVLFDLNFSVDPSLVNYRQALLVEDGGEITQ